MKIQSLISKVRGYSVRNGVALIFKLIILSVSLLGCTGSISTDSTRYYAVEGAVTDGDGHGIEDVKLISESGAIAYTDRQGHWRMTNLRGANRIVPNLDEWIFDPPEYRVVADSTNINFTGKKEFTSVEGLITTNTTWTIADSPYKVVGDIRIAGGARLTIEPGVHVYSDRQYNEPKIELHGDIHIEGVPEQPVILDDLSIVWSGYGGIHADHAIINRGLFAATDGNGSSGRLTLRDSQLIDVRNSLYIRHAPRATYIERNVFVRSPGVFVFMSGGKASLWPDDAKVYIRSNVFYAPLFNGRAAIHLDLPSVDDVIIRHNSFISKGTLALSARNWDATHNFWNTIVPAEIELMINDSFPGTSGTQYVPFLLEPHPDTPKLPDPLPYPPNRY